MITYFKKKMAHPQKWFFIIVLNQNPFAIVTGHCNKKLFFNLLILVFNFSIYKINLRLPFAILTTSFEWKMFKNLK